MARLWIGPEAMWYIGLVVLVQVLLAPLYPSPAWVLGNMAFAAAHVVLVLKNLLDEHRV